MSLEEIERTILESCAQAGRPRQDVTLIAVSKVQPDARVLDVIGAGHTVFGENRVQEAQDRWARMPADPARQLHLLGPLQTNKARPAAELFDTIHSLDRIKLAKTLARLAQERGTSPQMFVQVNTGEEPQKAGVLPADVDGFVAECRALDLPVAGLMVIPPVDETPSLHFSLLAKMAERNGLAGLSMGMSADFEQAIAFGATHIRVGTAIFGARG